jgi:hypothetical protein
MLGQYFEPWLATVVEGLHLFQYLFLLLESVQMSELPKRLVAP